MATTILTLANAIGRDTGSCLVRDNAGIPYFIGANGVLYEGNAVVPTGWTSRGTFGNGVIPPAMCMVTATTIGMIGSETQGMGTNLVYAIFNCATNTIGSSTTIVAIDGLSAANSWDIARDGNGDVHVVFRDNAANMGTDYFTVYYTNNIGGTFKTPVEIYGVAQQVFCHDVSIFINTGNIPEIRFDTNGSPTYEEKIGVGNLTNATSFTIHDGSGDISNSSGRHIISTSLGDTITIGDVTNGRDVGFYKHRAGDAWSSWEATIDNTYTNYGNGWAGVPYGDGTVFYIGDRDLSTDMVITQIDHSTTPGVNASFSAPVQIQAENASRIITKRARYLNYGSDGVDHGVADTQTEIDYVYLVGSSLKFDSFTINKRPTIVPNTAEANNFGADSTPTLEFTGTDDDGDDLEYEIHITDTLSTICDEHPVSEANDFLTLTDGGIVFVGQSFTGNGEKIKQAKLYLRKQAGLTSTVGCQIYAHSGTFGTSSIASGNEIAHASVPASALTTSFTEITFDFVGDESITLVNGTKYCVLIASWTLGGNIDVQSDTGQTSPHNGNASTYPTPTALPNEDLIFQILTEGAAIINKFSETPDAGFLNTVNGGDTHPFTEAEKISYTVQVGDALDAGTYYWKARANDPLGTDLWSDWTTQRSFIIEDPAGSIFGTTDPILRQQLDETGLASNSGTISKVGQLITGYNAQVNNFSLKLKELVTDIPSFLIKAEIWSISGGVPNTLLETSINSLDTADLTASFVWYDFYFSGTKYNQDIWIGIDVQAFGSGQMQHRRSTASVVAGETETLYFSSNWFNQSTDLTYKINSINGLKSLGTIIGIGELAGASNGVATEEAILNKVFISGTINGSTTTSVYVIKTVNISGTSFGGQDIVLNTEDQLTGNRAIVSAVPSLKTQAASATIIFGFTGRIHSFALSLIQVGDPINPSNLAWSATIRSVIGGLATNDVDIGSILETSPTTHVANDHPATGPNFETFLFNGNYYSGNIAIVVEIDGYTSGGNAQVQGETRITDPDIDNVRVLVQTNDAAWNDFYLDDPRGTAVYRLNYQLTAGNGSVNGFLSYTVDLAGISNGVATVQGLLTKKVSIKGVSNPTLYREQLTKDFNSSLGQLDEYGQKFIDFQGAIHDFTTIFNRSSGAVDYSIEARIYSCSALIPDALLETSTNSITASSLTPTNQDIEVKFLFTGKSYAGNIAIVIAVTNWISGTTASFKFTTPSTVSNENIVGNETGSGWNDLPTQDFYYKLNSDYKVSGTVTGTLSAKIGIAAVSNTTFSAYKESITGGSNRFLGVWDTKYAGQLMIGFESRVSSLVVQLRKTGSPVSDIRAKIFKREKDSLIFTDYTLKETSTNTISASSLTASYASYTFNFSGNAYVNGDILIALESFNETVGDISNYVVLKTDNANPIANENYIATISGVTTLFTNYPNDDFWYQLTYTVETNGTLRALGSLLGTINGVTTKNAVLTAVDLGGILGTINNNATTLGVLTAKGSLTGAINGTVTVTVSSITLKVDANINGVATVTGLLHADAKAFGTSNGVATTTSILTGLGDLSASINTSTTTVSVLTGKASLIGIINTTTTTLSDLTNGVTIQPIAVIVNGVATVSGILTANGTLQGIINAVATVDGTASARADLLGVINITITVTGTLSANGELAGASNGIASTSGLLNSNLQGSVIVNTTTLTTGTLTGQGALLGASNGIATTDSSLSSTQLIAGIINGVATVSGTLSANGVLAGNSNASATTSGVLTSNGLLSGESNGVGSTTSVLTAIGTLSGSSNGLASLSGLLNSNLQGSVIVNTDSLVTGTLTGSGALLGTSNGLATTQGNLVGETSISGTINGSVVTSGTLTAKGSLVGIITTSTTVQGLLISNFMFGTSDGVATVQGTLTANGSLLGVSNGTSILSGLLNSNLQGSVIVDTSTLTTGTLTGSGALVGTSNGSATTQGILSGQTSIVGIINGVASTSGTLTALGNLSGSSNGVATVQGNIITDALNGTSNGVATVQGILTANGSLVGQSNGSTTVQGALVSDAMLGTSDGIATTQGTLTANGSLIGVVNTTTTTQGTLNAKGSLEGTSNGSATVQGALISDAMIGVSNGIATTSGTLTGNGSLSGIVLGQATTDGSLISDAMAGVTNGTATTQGTLTGNGTLLGTINGTTTTLGALQLGLSGTINTLTIVSGTLTAIGLLSGASNGSSSTSGVLTSSGVLEGQSNGIATVQGTLSANGSLIGVINTSTTTQGILVSNAINGTSNGTSITSGTLTGLGNLVGVVTTLTTTQGTLSSNNLAGTSDGSATVQGTLTAAGFIIGVLEGLASGESLLDLNELTGLGALGGSSNGSTTSTAGVFSSGQIAGISNGSSDAIGSTLTGTGALVGVIEKEPIYFDLAEGSLIAKFFVFDESYGETIDIRNKAVEYIEFFMGKVGNPNFAMRAEIWSLDGSRLPQSLLQVSTTVIQAINVQSGILSYQRFYFDTIGANYNQEVGIVVHIFNHTVGDDANYIERIYGDQNHFKKGNILYNFTGALWSENLDQDINGAIQLVKSVSGNISGTMYGNVFGTTTVTGTLNANGVLSGTINGDSSAIGILSNPLVGNVSGVSTVTGTLIGIANLIGDSNGTATVIGTVLSDGTMLGEINGSSSVSGTLLGKVQMEGNTDTLSIVTGTLSGIGNLVGTSNGSSTVTLENSGSIGTLAGIINSVTTVTGNISYQSGASSNGSTTTSGTLTAIGSLSGTSNGSTSTQGTFLSPIAGESNGSTVVTGTLNAKGVLEGVINGYAVTSARETGIVSISGIINGSATVTGSIYSKGTLIGVINTYSQTSATIVPDVDYVVKISGISNGSSTVIGYMSDQASGYMDTSCFYEVIYLEPTCYPVEYEYEKYYVNYNCKI